MGVDGGQIEFIHLSDGRGIELRAAKDETLAWHRRLGYGLLYARAHLSALGAIIGISAHHYVFAPGQSAFGQRLKGAAAHNYGVTHGYTLKMLQIGGQVA